MNVARAVIRSRTLAAWVGLVMASCGCAAAKPAGKVPGGETVQVRGIVLPLDDASWLGACHAKGRHWDVISFNFGHWDAANTKARYQQNLEFIIAKMARTGAKLIWVTTCPVPNGNEKAGALSADGKAPGRKAGVMRKYLNSWAMEVMKRHPEIRICDQWQFVKDHAADLYAEWWKGRNVHFGGRPADELGRLLARCVLQTLGKDPDTINPPPQ